MLPGKNDTPLVVFTSSNPGNPPFQAIHMICWMGPLWHAGCVKYFPNKKPDADTKINNIHHQPIQRSRVWDSSNFC
jgi:hypothetical protein